MHDLAKAEWLKALRSGNYTQGRGFLARSEEKNGQAVYCCLGVLCDVAQKFDANVSVSSKDGYIRFYDKSAGNLPESVRIWAGLDSGDPEVRDDESSTAPLSVFNDDYEFTFEEIADLIEENL